MSKAVPSPRKTKSIALSIILNATPLVIFGLGYLYIGKWKRFMIVEILQLFCLISPKLWGIKFDPYLLGIVWVVSIIDVLIQTDNYNQQILKPIG
jgi:hypothetical protein